MIPLAPRKMKITLPHFYAWKFSITSIVALPPLIHTSRVVHLILQVKQITTAHSFASTDPRHYPQKRRVVHSQQEGKVNFRIFVQIEI